MKTKSGGERARVPREPWERERGRKRRREEERRNRTKIKLIYEYWWNIKKSWQTGRVGEKSVEKTEKHENFEEEFSVHIGPPETTCEEAAPLTAKLFRSIRQDQGNLLEQELQKERQSESRSLDVPCDIFLPTGVLDSDIGFELFLNQQKQAECFFRADPVLFPLFKLGAVSKP